MPASDAPIATRVMTRCALDETEVFTGHRMRPAEMQSVQSARSFRCGHCGAIHSWTPASAWNEERARWG